MNTINQITELMTKWHKLTCGRKPLEAGIMLDWRSGLPPSYSAYLYSKNDSVDREFFDTVNNAQEWLTKQLTDMLEQEQAETKEEENDDDS
jgi:hypothetical protein